MEERWKWEAWNLQLLPILSPVSLSAGFQLNHTYVSTYSIQKNRANLAVCQRTISNQLQFCLTSRSFSNLNFRRIPLFLPPFFFSSLLRHACVRMCTLVRVLLYTHLQTYICKQQICRFLSAHDSYFLSTLPYLFSLLLQYLARIIPSSSPIAGREVKEWNKQSHNPPNSHLPTLDMRHWRKNSIFLAPLWFCQRSLLVSGNSSELFLPLILSPGFVFVF